MILLACVVLVLLLPGDGGAEVLVSRPAIRPSSRPIFQKGMTFAHGYRPQNNLMSPGSQKALLHLRQQMHVMLKPHIWLPQKDDDAWRAASA
jgi:hypothetical protein